jgi:glycerate-2-kinase
MAQAVERVLGDELLADKQVSGWVNVPEDCVRQLQRVHVHAARPATVNEPTDAGVEGSARILEIVSGLTGDDLAICLISGGGSALLPSPLGVSLEEKQQVTRFLSAAGANINELNAVRKRLSRIKGGGLARSSRAGSLVSLVISDVIGDPLETIASGPTAEDSGTFQQARAVLEKYGARPPAVSQNLLDYIDSQMKANPAPEPFPSNVFNYVIGNNRTALDAAEQKAVDLGYRVVNLSSYVEGHAEDVGQVLAGIARGIRDEGKPAPPPACVLSGGEPVVSLAPPERRGRGGRNQQLVLSALEWLARDGWHARVRVGMARRGLDDIVILSGGTDGEDGPTDAAGALADAQLAAEVESRALDPKAYLANNDAYSFFDQVDGLIKTGPTNTNVMDVRVVLVGKS